MLDLITVFGSQDFIPHGHCYLWQSPLVWLHLLSDSFTALAYYSIPIFLIALALKRQDLPFRPLFWLFGGFIISCGTTHAMEVVTLWYPVYWLSGMIKAITALLSVWTALELIPLFPPAVALPSIAQYELANRALQQEVAERQQVETALRESQALNTRLSAAALKEKEDVLALFAQYAPAGIAMFDQEMRYVMASQRWVDDYYLGTVETLIGRSQYDVFPQIPERWRQIHQQCLAGATESCDEDLFVRADGVQKTVRWEICPWLMSSGDVGGIIIFAEDITERKQVEAKLKEQEASYRQLFESNPHPMWVYDLETLRFLAVNPVAIAKYGYSEAEFLAMTIADIRPPEDIPRLRENVASVSQGIDFAGIWRHRLKDGRLITVEITSHTLEFAGRRAELVLANDVTERQAAAAALKESEQRFQVLVEAMFEGIVIQEYGKIFEANPGFARMFGYSVEAVIGKTAAEFLTSESLELLRQHMENQDELPYEVVGIKQDGTRIDLEVVGKQSVYQGRSVRVSAARDITARKQAERALQHLNAELEQRVADRTAELKTLSDRLMEAQEIAHIGSWEWDVVTGTIFWSDEIFLLFGLEPGQPEPDYESHLEQHFMPEEGQRLRQAVARALEQGEAYELDLEIIRADGSTGWIFAKGKPILNEQNQVVRLVGVALDITARKTVEIQQERLSHLKDDFLSTVSHELRSPLASIRMAIGMLEVAFQQLVPLPGASSFAQPDRLQKYLEILREQCDQELELVNRLLDLQRLEAGRIEVNLAPIQVSEWVSNIAAAFEGRIQERQQHLQVLLPTDCPPLISDIGILSSVLRELLTNACKYTPPGETITVSVCLAQEHLLLRVSNSGVQIAQDELERVFDKFYRIPGGDPCKQGGTGLGLALAKRQIKYLGGTMAVESNELGVHFVIRLPVNEPDDSNQPLHSSSADEDDVDLKSQKSSLP